MLFAVARHRTKWSSSPRCRAHVKLLHKVGTARADITGPIGAQMKGFAFLQVAEGLHMRQYARAFVFEDGSDGAETQPKKCVAFVNLDLHSCSQKLKQLVVQNLQNNYKLADVFSEQNVMLSSIHTHSGIGGWDMQAMYEMNSPQPREWNKVILDTLSGHPPQAGILEEYLSYMADRIAQAISNAYTTKAEAEISYAKGHITGCSINRSPHSFVLNRNYDTLPIKPTYKKIYKDCFEELVGNHSLALPKKEDEFLPFPKDTTAFLIKIAAVDGPFKNSDIGMITYFPVHGTSFSINNRLISSDNKGAAEYFFETWKEPERGYGKTNFVAAFVQANCGDISPNIKGEQGPNGEEADDYSCVNGRPSNCRANGPGQLKTRNEASQVPGLQQKYETESNKIIGKKQFEQAREMYQSVKQETSEETKNYGVRSILLKVEMSKHKLSATIDDTDPRSSSALLKGPRLGYSFAAGTTDGPDDFEAPHLGLAKQGTENDEEIGYRIADALHLELGFHPGGPMEPDLVPRVVPLQIFQIGNIFVVGVPGEFTSMSGMILRESVKQAIQKVLPNIEPVVILAGLANAYSQYITTPLEYEKQRYEGASTLFGRWTLFSYVELYTMMVEKLLKGESVSYDVQERVNPPVVVKQLHLPWEKKYKGEYKVVKNTKSNFVLGSENVVEFQVQTHHPGKDFALLENYFVVERETQLGTGLLYTPILSDADFETTSTYDPKTNIFTFRWNLTELSATDLGRFRISYYYTDPKEKRKKVLPSSIFSITL